MSRLTLPLWIAVTAVGVVACSGETLVSVAPTGSGTESSSQLQVLRPDPGFVIIPAPIESIDVTVQGFRRPYVTVVVNGTLQCASQLLPPRILVRGQQIKITLLEKANTLVDCFALIPFTEKIPVGTLNPGIYQVQVNAVTETIVIRQPFKD